MVDWGDGMSPNHPFPHSPLMDFSSILHEAGAWIAWTTVGLLCLVGVLLSCLTISGTWCVVLASVLAAGLTDGLRPHWNLVFLFIALAIGIELIEWFASAWGVQKRGGSKAAGFAALFGGIAGLFLGTFIPIPIVGSLVGMMAGSFGLAYAVEKRRLKEHDRAMHIAWGTVTARVLVLFLKVGATLAMIAFLGFAVVQ